MKTIIARQMHVQLVLDDVPSTLTNLDTLNGKVVLRLFATTPLSNITVKLEGESKTRLKGSVQSATGQVRAEEGVGDKLVIREETHKVCEVIANCLVIVARAISYQATEQA